MISEPITKRYLENDTVKMKETKLERQQKNKVQNQSIKKKRDSFDLIKMIKI